MNDETIRLILDLANSSKDVQELTQKLHALGSQAKDTATDYMVLDRQVGTYSISTSQATTATDKAVSTAVEQTRAQRAMHALLDEAPAKLNAAGKSTANLGQAGLTAGRALQDFTQGGIAGILNNIEGLSTALGGGPGLAGVLTAVGVAAFVAMPYLEEIGKLFVAYKDKIPESADSVKRFTESIEKNNKAIKEMKEQVSLDFFEMEKYNKLVKDTAEQEEALANARAARGVSQYENKADRARAAAFREALGEFGGGEKLIGEIMGRGDTRQRAEQMIADAIRGNLTEIGNITRNIPGVGNLYVSPEQAAQRKAQEEVRKRIDRDVKAQQQEIEQRAKDEDEGDTAKAKKIQRDRALGRAIGKVAQAQEEKAAKPVSLPQGDHVREIRANDTDFEIRQTLLDSQAKLQAQQARDVAFLQQARQVNRRITQVNQGGLDR